jgi:hypothetical protein
MHLRNAKRSVTFAAVILIAAWFSISNHCALSAAIGPKTQSATAPMHCHGNQPAPSKKSGGEEMPCCKILRATLSSAAKITQHANKIWQPFHYWTEVASISAAYLPHSSGADELDTGPPFARSFAENVLQRSLPSNAPPFVELKTAFA